MVVGSMSYPLLYIIMYDKPMSISIVVNYNFLLEFFHE